MAEETEQQQPQNLQDSSKTDSIPVVAIPGSKSKTYGNIFLLSMLLIGEAVLAYWLVAANYDQLHEWVYGSPPDFAGYYEIEDVVINPAETEGQRVLLVSIGLEVANDDHLEEIEQYEVAIRDAMINMLSRRTVPELSSTDEREDIKQEMGIMINEILGKRSVRNLFFTEYVMH